MFPKKGQHLGLSIVELGVWGATARTEAAPIEL